MLRLLRQLFAFKKSVELFSLLDEEKVSIEGHRASYELLMDEFNRLNEIVLHHYPDDAELNAQLGEMGFVLGLFRGEGCVQVSSSNVPAASHELITPCGMLGNAL